MMKVLYILTKDLDETEKIILDEHKKYAEIKMIDLRKEKNYDKIISLVEEVDKIITW